MQPGATLVATYCKALLALCEAQSAGFDQHAHWIRRALAVLGAAADASKVAMCAVVRAGPAPPRPGPAGRVPSRTRCGRASGHWAAWDPRLPLSL